MDSVAIMSGSKKTDLAYKFINALYDPGVQAAIAKQKKGSPVVTNAKLDPDLAKLPGVFTSAGAVEAADRHRSEAARREASGMAQVVLRKHHELTRRRPRMHAAAAVSADSVKTQPFVRSFVTPAALCAFGFLAAMAAVLQYSVRAFIPGSLEPGGFTLANFAALLRPLYARVFVDTVWICFLTAVFTLIVGYPLAYALVHVRNRFAKSFILITVITPLFLGEVVRTYSWIIVLGNDGFINAALLKLGAIAQPIQFMFTTFGVVVALVHVTMPVMVIILRRRFRISTAIT